MTGETERWTYIGRRAGSGGATLLGVWLDPNGARCAFKCKHRVIGGVYEVPNVERDGAGNVTKAGVDRTSFVNATTESAVAGWQADDRAAFTTDQARKLEASARKRSAEDFGALTLNEVRSRLLNAGPQRTALLANVLRHLGA